VILLAVGIAAAIAAASRGGDKAPKPHTPPTASNKTSDDADLMRRLQRNNLLHQQSNGQHR
jgi:hypothetical protein